ncbi:hypothetical protein [Stenotrophomonas tumulicola]|uniref:Uncharacterized protein n=1 Tax=Stenotrophomonas tumulicola TaxID=1685415 RepID=A0A7W3IG69_9GAMM|nr:hypothetical protein [Stenotrophomonas tumulicola]MBA8680482.1 hypothetical protein [Stenotrophomonas tumulicola]
MFELNDAAAKVANFNPRAEKHGEENKLAGDLKCVAVVNSGVLDFFNKELRKALYRKATPGEQQDLIEGTDGLTAVKFPRLGSLSWAEEYPGYELIIGSGLGLSEPIAITDVTLKRFKFEPLEGGSLQVTFSAVFHPTSEEAGLLCALIQNEVSLTLVSPLNQGKSNKPVQEDLAA